MSGPVRQILGPARSRLEKGVQTLHDRIDSLSDDSLSADEKIAKKFQITSDMAKVKRYMETVMRETDRWQELIGEMEADSEELKDEENLFKHTKVWLGWKRNTYCQIPPPQMWRRSYHT